MTAPPEAALLSSVLCPLSTGATLAPACNRASTCPTSTTSSGSTSASSSLPETGDGTSASILSVDTSTTGSPSATSSPGCLSHSRTVPSVTDSPISGITRSTDSPAAPSPDPVASSPWYSDCSVAASASSPMSASPSPAALVMLGAAPEPSPVPFPPGSSSASASPILTTSSGPLRIFVSVPAAGDGTSASILSVETSTRDSPSSTRSPSSLSQSSTVPSVTDSPIAGISTWTVSTAGTMTVSKRYSLRWH